MVHDYATGLHYSIVEHGRFLRNGCGLSQQQWFHLTTFERGNLVSSRAMGAVEYMRLVRQSFTPEGQADVTDSPNSDGPDEPMGISTAAPAGLAEGQTLSEMIEFLKAEHAQCLERNELWDANSVQNLILSFLDEVRSSSARSMINRCREKIAEVFGE